MLGSTQPESIVDRAATRGGRGGGGAAAGRGRGGADQPGDPLWVDVWIPRGDPLYDEDARRSAVWVGEWWGRGRAVAALTGRPAAGGRLAVAAATVVEEGLPPGR